MRKLLNLDNPKTTGAGVLVFVLAVGLAVVKAVKTGSFEIDFTAILGLATAVGLIGAADGGR